MYIVGQAAFGPVIVAYGPVSDRYIGPLLRQRSASSRYHMALLGLIGGNVSNLHEYRFVLVMYKMLFEIFIVYCVAECSGWNLYSCIRTKNSF